MQLPADRVPAVEIARVGVGERNAEAGGEEEELLQHFSQPRPLHWPSWGFRGHAQEGRSGCHYTQSPSPFWLPSQECWSALWEYQTAAGPGPSRVGKRYPCLGGFVTQDPPFCPAGGGCGLDPARLAGSFEFTAAMPLWRPQERWRVAGPGLVWG